MTTQSQRNRDATVFLVSRNAVITAPKPPPLPPLLSPSSATYSNCNKQKPNKNGLTGKKKKYIYIHISKEKENITEDGERKAVVSRKIP